MNPAVGGQKTSTLKVVSSEIPSSSVTVNVISYKPH
jgi:hypothetical protein